MKDYLQKNYRDYEFTVIYSSKNEDNRSWEIDQEKMKNSIFLESKTIKLRLKKRMDTRYIHFPVGVTKVLKKKHTVKKISNISGFLAFREGHRSHSRTSQTVTPGSRTGTSPTKAGCIYIV